MSLVIVEQGPPGGSSYDKGKGGPAPGFHHHHHHHVTQSSHSTRVS
jgi:hypothetical protein